MRLGLVIFSLVFFFNFARADLAGVKAGVGTWNYDVSGSVRYQGTDADIENGFRISDNNEAFFWLAIEHPVPGLPNLKLMHTRLSTDGSGTVNSSFTFGNSTYNVGNDVTSELTLNQTDVILYYELLDTQVHFDLGLNFKVFDGTAKVRSTAAGANEQVDFTGVLPMVYASLSVKLPFTGLSVGVEGSTASYSGNTLSDVMAKVSYVTKAKVGFEVGYRRMNLKLDDLDSFNSDITIDGPFAAVKFEF